MPGELEAAAIAYHAAVRRRDDAKVELARARADIGPARLRLARAIVAAYEDGRRVGELAETTRYGREQVRRILRSAGIEAE